MCFGSGAKSSTGIKFLVVWVVSVLGSIVENSDPVEHAGWISNAPAGAIAQFLRELSKAKNPRSDAGIPPAFGTISLLAFVVVCHFIDRGCFAMQFGFDQTPSFSFDFSRLFLQCSDLFLLILGKILDCPRIALIARVAGGNAFRRFLLVPVIRPNRARYVL